MERDGWSQGGAWSLAFRFLLFRLFLAGHSADSASQSAQINALTSPQAEAGVSLKSDCSQYRMAGHILDPAGGSIGTPFKG